ncbi:E3 ubiquitin-protein ligase NEURL3 isoform X1 [Rhinolophus sinicus]|uniref:E3 ubiquitin-protein ligase NEURL3 isoform X1 n=1 Tax=Rhinolophus sinicus TaxID=89399 RepID=UPI003D7BEDE3
MGAQLCSQADAKVPPETLRFHPEAKGAQVHLDRQRSTACRRATFHDGIVFSQRPVRPGERVALRVLGHQGGWYGGLRVGFTRLDPAHVSAPSLPPFVCPDLEQQSPTWAAMLPNGCALAGDMVCFWVNRRGWLWAQVNAGPRLLLRKGVRMGAPLWAVMDVYGTTKAIELLDPAASAFPTAAPWALREDTWLSEPEGEHIVFQTQLPGSLCCGYVMSRLPTHWPDVPPTYELLCPLSQPQQERSVSSAFTEPPIPALSPAATCTSVATAPGGSLRKWPSVPCVAGRLRRWSRHRVLLP